MLGKLRLSLLLRLLGIICGLWIIEENNFGQDEKFKALFIYNFTKYIQWPDNFGNEFVITVIGNSDMVNELSFIATKKTVGQSSITVVNAKSASEVKKCQIVFISHGNMNELSKLIERSKEYNTLIITESPKSCSQGACINFVSMSGSIKFEISKTNLESSGLKVNATLMNLGIAAN
jgi:vacuolar-type H+-ATPase subunit F/Vma7